MPSTYQMTLSSPPSANRYWRNVRGRSVVSEEGRVYKEQVGWEARAQGVHEALEGELAVRMKWYREAKRGDLDNRIKIPLDALQGIAYENDSQIGAIEIERYEDPSDPRLEIELRPRWQKQEEANTMFLTLVLNLGSEATPIRRGLSVEINPEQASGAGEILSNACKDNAPAVVLPTADNAWIFIPQPQQTVKFAMASPEALPVAEVERLISPSIDFATAQALSTLDPVALDIDEDEDEEATPEDTFGEAVQKRIESA